MEEEQLDPKVFAAWKKDISTKIKQAVIFKEKIPAVLRRCPKCQNLTLEFDPSSARISCSRCGFSEYLKL